MHDPERSNRDEEPRIDATPTEAPTALEEFVHALTHGVGAVGAVVALVALVASAAVRGEVLHVTVASVFGATLTLVYVTSTVYHALSPRRARAKLVWQILDHSAIHLLIAGTYTPFAVVAIGGLWGLALAALAWSLAAIGLLVETTPLRHRTRLSMGLYLTAGWLGALGLPWLVAVLPTDALVYLVLGGVAYTTGVPFFLVEGRRWMHAVWHGFVLAGSAFHVAAVALVLSP